VDDEAQSLKYFRKAYDQDLEVLTASDTDAAWRILEENAERIGVLLTDQRMPGGSGTDLLERVRLARPSIVRILTTAYSDLDSAIAAVNSGAVFKYVVKPWNLQDLRGVLLRAMDYYLVQRERDILLRAKLNVLQRLILTDRVRSFAVLAAGLSHHIRNSMGALNAFLDLAPQLLGKELPEDQQLKVDDPSYWEHLWSIARVESEHILQMVEQVAEATVEPRSVLDAEWPLAQLVGVGVARTRLAAEARGQTIAVDIDEYLPPFRVSGDMMRNFFHLVLQRVVRLSPPGASISVTARAQVPVWGTRGVRIMITGSGPDWTDEQVGGLFTAFSASMAEPENLGLDVLSAFFILYHHGGEMVVHQRRPDGPGFAVFLPFDPEATKRPVVEEDCVERIFRHSDAWQSLQ
jgi:two-component system probable response regulator PhcQ